MRRFRQVLLVALVMCTAVGCADRIEPPVPVTYLETDKLKDWSESHAQPYGIPERSLRAYSYAAVKVGEEKCELGWPTIAAIGAVVSHHGFVHGSKIQEDGTSTIPLRNVDIAPIAIVADTDQGRIDGTNEFDIPVGPLQIMPSRWEQFEAAAEPGTTPNPDSVDDSALVMARQICSFGNLKNPNGWDEAVKSISADPEFVKAVHEKATEYSR